MTRGRVRNGYQGTANLPPGSSGRRCGRSPARARDAGRVASEIELFNREQVKRGLAARRSLARWHGALGVSRQAAHRRSRDLAQDHGPRVTPTEPARHVLRLAREEALAMQAAALGSEHVLIAVLRHDGDAAQALAGEGATLGRVRPCVRALTAARERPLSLGDLSRVCAARFARRRNGRSRKGSTRSTWTLFCWRRSLTPMVARAGFSRRSAWIWPQSAADLRASRSQGTLRLCPWRRSMRRDAFPHRPLSISVEHGGGEVRSLRWASLGLAAADRLGQAVTQVLARRDCRSGVGACRVHRRRRLGCRDGHALRGQRRVRSCTALQGPPACGRRLRHRADRALRRRLAGAASGAARQHL